MSWSFPGEHTRGQVARSAGSAPFGVPQPKPSGGGGRNGDKRIMFLATALKGKQRLRTLGGICLI
jgi:hypothetical protein